MAGCLSKLDGCKKEIERSRIYTWKKKDKKRGHNLCSFKETNLT
jgi:hypothetical protein